MLNIEQIQQYVMDSEQLQIVGSASQVQATHDNILDMSQYAGVVEYHPEELVITVKAGTTIKQIRDLLAENKQVIPFFIAGDGNATIGGAYAIGSAELRDAILGIKLIDGQGQHLTFGGQVMKNVAGYDVSRLLVGSQGKLAVICEISFKVIPQAYANQVDQQVTTKIQNISPVKTRIEQGLKNIFDPKSVFI
ncbi:MAG: FAD-binding protein [Methylophagaceae bacterium]